MARFIASCNGFPGSDLNIEIKHHPIKLLHTADIHLDARFSGLPAAKRQQRRQGLRDTFNRVVDEALKNKVDVLIISGDLFDSHQPAIDTINFVLHNFKRLDENDIAVVLVPGNHDYFAEDSVFSQATFPPNVHVFKSDSWENFVLPNNGVNFLGIACHAFSSTRNVLAEMNQKQMPTGCTVALLHGSLDYGFYDGEQCYPFSLDDVKGLKIDYLALGHYHNSTSNGAGNLAYYPGSPEGLKFTETGTRHALLIKISDRRVTVEKIAVNRFIYEQADLDCTNFSTSEQIRQAISGLADENKLLRIELTGAPDLDLDITFDGTDLAQRFFHLEIINGLRIPKEFSQGGDYTIKALFLERMASRLAAAATDEEKREINLAIRLGIAALDGRLK